jgi:hypothetical protein
MMIFGFGTRELLRICAACPSCGRHVLYAGPTHSGKSAGLYVLMVKLAVRNDVAIWVIDRKQRGIGRHAPPPGRPPQSDRPSR